MVCHAELSAVPRDGSKAGGTAVPPVGNPQKGVIMSEKFNRLSRRSFLKLTGAAAGVGGAAMLSGCGGGGDTASNGGNGGAGSAAISAEGTDDGTEITLWTRSPLERQAQNAVDAYNASHKNQVKLEIIPNDDMEGRVGGASQTDSLPDILAGDVVRIPYWASEGIFADITEQIDGLDNLDDLQQGHIEAGTIDGAKYVLPFVTDISVMVWNKALYEEAGLDPEHGPATYAEFEEQAKAVAALNKDGVAGSYLAGQSGGALTFKLFPSIWADGEEVMSEDGTEANMASDTAKAVYKVWRNLAETENGLGEGSKEETGATWTAPFANGNIGVMPYPNTSIAAIIEAEANGGFECGVCIIPGTEAGDGSTYLGGDAMGISRNCEHVDQAWNFIAWLMTEDAQQEVFADNNDTASNLKVLANGYENADERVKTFNATIEHGRTPKAIYFNEAFNAAGSPWQILIQDAIWGDESKIDDDNQAINDVLGQ